MRITVTGARGMLGRALEAALASEQHQLHLIDLPECDISDREAVGACLEAFGPEAVIHAAAYTDVDGCERDPALATRVNAEGTGNVAEAAAAASRSLMSHSGRSIR